MAIRLRIAINEGGARRIRTADQGFADPCLTAWLWRQARFEGASITPVLKQPEPDCTMTFSTYGRFSSSNREEGDDGIIPGGAAALERD